MNMEEKYCLYARYVSTHIYTVIYTYILHKILYITHINILYILHINVNLARSLEFRQR